MDTIAQGVYLFSVGLRYSVHILTYILYYLSMNKEIRFNKIINFGVYLFSVGLRYSVHILRYILYYLLMNKGICFNKIIIFGQHCIGQWPIQCWFISCMFFIIFHGEKKSLLQEKEYNWAISYQIKKEICFNIYNQLIRTTLHRLVIYSMFV